MSDKLKKTKLGNIPFDWEFSNVGKYCEVLTGGTPSTKIKNYFEPPEIPWMRSTEVNRFRINSLSTYISKEGLKNSAAKLLPKKSVVIALSGQGKTRGKTALLEIESSCNQSMACIVPNKRVNYIYLHYFLNKLYRYIRNITGDVGREGLNLKLVKKLPLILPPLEEQNKIASFLLNIDEIFIQTQKIINKLEIIKKGLMQRFFTEGIGHTEFKSYKQKNIPKSWEILDFQESIKPNKQILGSLKKSEYNIEGLYPIIDQGQKFIAGYSDKEDLLYNGDLPIVIFGDHTRIFKFIDFRFICGADGTKILIPNTEYFDPSFLYYYFSHLRIKNLGYSRHFKLLKESIVFKPDIDEQIKISNILGNIDRNIHNELEYKEKMIKIKRGLMQVLLTGKKRVSI